MMKLRKGKVWFTSVRKFKGLEAKAVLLIDGDVSKLHKPLMQRISYVGCSRANDYLQIALCRKVALLQIQENFIANCYVNDLVSA